MNVLSTMFYLSTINNYKIKLIEVTLFFLIYYTKHHMSLDIIIFQLYLNFTKLLN